MNGFDVALGLLADAGLKAVFILAASELVLLVLRNSSAALRHSVRLFAFIAVLLLPLASWMTPAAAKPFWSVSSERVAGNQIALSVRLAPQSAVSLPAKVVSGRQEKVAQKGRPTEVKFRLRWALAALWLWVTGVLISLAPVAVGFDERRRLVKRVRAADAPNLISILRDEQEALRIRRNVVLMESIENVVPLTWGSVKPIILLPDAAREWSEEKVRLTLLHELAHVQRWDCLIQVVVHFICALHWFNPLGWRAARAMRLDREQACDDAVLNASGSASSYAEHLLEIAANLRALRPASGIPIARRSQLEERVSSLLSSTRSRQAPAKLTRIAIALTTAGIATALAAQKVERSKKEEALREKQLAVLKEFAKRKEKQAEVLTKQNKEEFFPEFREFFAAAKDGDWQTVTNMYVDFRHRHGQYSGATDDLPHTPYWNTVLEVCLAYADVTWGEPEHVQLAIEGFLQSIPAGAIYFGGTDPGRGFPTAFSKDHAAADPFFTFTQNALADATYLDYLRAMYGARVYTPSPEDSQNAFADYIKEVTARHRAGQLKPGENVSISDNRTSVSGQTAVMEINGRLAQIIFDKNPDREFYIEESFPLDWMYPYLVPNGQVMRINRKPFETISNELIKTDTDYWNARLARFLGTPTEDGISTKKFLSFVDRVYIKHLLPRGADAKFFANDWAQRAFSKWRSGIAGVYVWRAMSTKDSNERDRMRKAAEHALRDAYALCPTSPEVIQRYTSFLRESGRASEATLVSEKSAAVAEGARNAASATPRDGFMNNRND